MNTPANLKYTKSDEWFDPATGKMGLTDYAQSQLSDIVFVELLVEAGDELESGSRVEVNEEKKSPLDFALWKKAKEGEPFWESRWALF